jgi:hypothetical protein
MSATLSWQRSCPTVLATLEYKYQGTHSTAERLWKTAVPYWDLVLLLKNLLARRALSFSPLHEYKPTSTDRQVHVYLIRKKGI